VRKAPYLLFQRILCLPRELSCTR